MLTDEVSPMSRLDELRSGLAAVEERIVAGCAAAERDRSGVTLVVVTKTYPATDVRLLAELGVREVGESRDQEAGPKVAELEGLGLSWHFIGQLQSNKARSVARYADVLHTLDRPSLVSAVQRAVAPTGRTLRCFIQVSLDGDPSRGGAGMDAVPTLADQIAGAPGLELAGVMAVAPMNIAAGDAFARLQDVSLRLRAAHPSATDISAGMSGDLEEALCHGATHLRVGSAVLGQRPPLG
jgi:pyridoxal phosphate enzyme (YggS family)